VQGTGGCEDGAMADADRDRWDVRYAAAPSEVEPVAPDRLRPVIDRVPTSGRALDVACGTGAQTLWAAHRGLHVDAFDISPIAVEHLLAAARSQGVAPMIDARSADLDAGLPDEAAGPYDLVIVQRFRAPHLYSQLLERLGPGGVLVVSVLSEVGVAGRPGPFHAVAGELERSFAGCHVETLLSQEADGLATVVLQRPGVPG
jgi:SAM-dependent methyltransferase